VPAKAGQRQQIAPVGYRLVNRRRAIDDSGPAHRGLLKRESDGPYQLPPGLWVSDGQYAGIGPLCRSDSSACELAVHSCHASLQLLRQFRAGGGHGAPRRCGQQFGDADALVELQQKLALDGCGKSFRHVSVTIHGKRRSPTAIGGTDDQPPQGHH
jgi:hypothetical protein